MRSRKTHAWPTAIFQLPRDLIGTPLSERGLAESGKRSTPLGIGRLSLLVLLFICGCAFRPIVSSDAVSFNRSVETTQNRTLLTNVMRAAERRPLYFTDLAKITGTVSARFAVDLMLPFDGIASTFSAKPGAAIQGGPTYDVLTLNTKEFMNGIMTPASPDLFRYYSDQGWPLDLLLFMFVREVRKKDGTSLLVNQPGNAEQMKKFAEFVRSLADRKPKISAGKIWDVVAEDISEVTPAAAVDAQKSNMRFVRQKDGTYSLEASKLIVTLSFAVGESLSIDSQEKDEKSGRTITVSIPVSSIALASGPPPDRSGRGLAAQSAVDANAPVDFILRSPEGMIYYLGEIAREKLRSPTAVLPRVKPSDTQALSSAAEPRGDWPLFVVRRGAIGDGAVEIGRGGSRYYIPEGEEEAGRSMNCFTLVVQVIGLHKTRDTSPTTQTVIGVGPIP